MFTDVVSFKCRSKPSGKGEFMDASKQELERDMKFLNAFSIGSGVFLGALALFILFNVINLLLSVS